MTKADKIGNLVAAHIGKTICEEDISKISELARSAAESVEISACGGAEIFRFDDGSSLIRCGHEFDYFCD